MMIQGLISQASNIKGGDNPPFDIETFKLIYPQFFETTEDTKPRIPLDVIDMYIDFAHSCVKESRYHKGWEICMGLFIAHFTTLYMQSMSNPEGDAATVVQAGQAKGLAISKSVDGVSVSYDFSQTMQDLEGWAAWKATAYGTQLITLAKMYGKGGMYIP